MIALDTNVLVRYLVEDEPVEQCERAARLVDETIAAGEAIFLSNIVLCEFVWVLESCYGLEREPIADLLETLLDTEQLRFSEPSQVERALVSYRRGEADFADFLIREVALGAGCSSIATFDKALVGGDDFFAPS